MCLKRKQGQEPNVCPQSSFIKSVYMLYDFRCMIFVQNIQNTFCFFGNRTVVAAAGGRRRARHAPHAPCTMARSLMIAALRKEPQPNCVPLSSLLWDPPVPSSHISKCEYQALDPTVHDRTPPKLPCPPYTSTRTANADPSRIAIGHRHCCPPPQDLRERSGTARSPLFSVGLLHLSLCQPPSRGAHSSHSQFTLSQALAVAASASAIAALVVVLALVTPRELRTPVAGPA